MKFWPKQEWESFYMWSNPKAGFLSNIDRKKIIPLTCVNFLPYNNYTFKEIKIWDICIVSRPSEIKRIKETLLVIKDLFLLKKDLNIIFIVPDPRKQSLGNRTYKSQDIDRSFFELPLKIFTCQELRQISFISSSQEFFGNFPISDKLMHELISESKFVFLNSEKEGVPRIIIEALSKGVPCILSKNLNSGLNYLFKNNNSLFIDNSISLAAKQIDEALKNYDMYKFDYSSIQKEFLETFNKPILKKLLLDLIEPKNNFEDDIWYLDDLFLRLASHGRKNEMQFLNNEKLFFKWISNISNLSFEMDEDILFEGINFEDKSLFSIFRLKENFKLNILFPILSGSKLIILKILKKLKFIFKF